MAWNILSCLLVSSLIMTFHTSLATAYCDSGWAYRFGRCYQFWTNTGKDFAGATLACNQQGGMLASINSQEEHDFFVSMRTVDDWTLIGGNDRKKEETWLWADGKPAYTASVYTNWGPLEPNSNGDQDCMFIAPSTAGVVGDRLKWTDFACSAAGNTYICQKPSVVTAATKSNLFSRRATNQKSLKTPLSTHTVNSLTECVALCVQQDGCLSVNICDGRTVCDILDVDMADVLTESSGCDVYSFDVQFLE